MTAAAAPPHTGGRLRDFRFEIESVAGMARAGVIHTPHGDILTPTFTVVGTHGFVKFLSPEALHSIGTQAMLSNGYHLFRHADRVQRAGGLAAEFGWNGPTVTDSGGFQAMSLGSGLGKVISMDRADIADARRPAPVEERLARVTDEGVLFRHPSDGRLDLFTPEVSIKAQFQLGADIIMAFDELTSIGDSYDYNVQALNRTEKWAQRSLDCIRSLQSDHPEKPYQALYGILQGAHYKDLRESTATVLGAMGFDGYGLGGAFEKEQLSDILYWTNSILPAHKPRHLLGLARPDDIFVGVSMGIDTFDCVSPTREARHGRLYTSDGHINLMRSQFREDYGPIEAGCDCPTCNQGISSPVCGSENHIPRALIRKLLRSHDQGEKRLAYQYTSTHNVRFILRLMENIRESIKNGTFAEFRHEWLARYYR
ncbi:MAG: tRNA guanosine(34) transglycosylase Tgt [Cellulomonadaceae bacterium]|nr:tRNA guanosine(34) transglycosylase Tgt [Cellulomonadaceae bacterium]